MNSSSATNSAPGARHRLTLQPSGLFPVLLARIVDHELDQIAPFTQPIEPDYHHELRRSLARQRLELSSVFLAAQDLFGRTSARFDPDKGSFRFPLLLSATRHGVGMRYLVMLRDHRGSLEVHFHRLQEEEPVGVPRGYQPPVDRELSRADLNHVADHLLGYLDGYGETLAPTALPFHRAVRADFLIYGARSGEFFERQFESAEAYERAVDSIARELAEAERQQEFTVLRGLLDDMQGP